MMHSEKQQLKSDLQRMKKNQFELSEGEGVSDYISLMLQYIGDTDAELRDDLIYETFCEWICEKEYFNGEELLHILSILLDEKHLFYHIGNDEDDTVFTRTFSVLVIVLIIFQHRKKPFIAHDLFIKIKDNLIRYYEEERDLRGFLGEKGWAHGAAHGADAMDELIQCEESDEVVYQQVLGAIQKVLFNGKYSFSNEEDERITRVILRIIKRNCMSNKSLSNWIEGLSQCCDWEKDRNQYVTRINTKNFIRCLYFKLMHYDNTLDIINVVFKVEERLNRFLIVDKELLLN
jgi:hypothetical protein